MRLPTWVSAVLGDSAFLWAVGAAMVVLVGLLLVEHRRAWGELALLAGFATGVLAGTLHLGVALAAVTGGVVARWATATPSAARTWDAVLLSITAAAAVYACLPDTELALAVLGSVAVAGGVAIVQPAPWRATGAATVVTLAVVSVIDGRARPTAVVGGLGIAAVLLLASASPRGDRRWTAVLTATTVIAMLVCSRVAGRGHDTGRALVIAGACVAAVGTVAFLSGRSSHRPVQGVSPPFGDG